MAEAPTALELEEMLLASAQNMGAVFKIQSFVSRPIVLDVLEQIGKSLTTLGFKDPNQPKIAGVTAFWIRKLKPLYQTASDAKIFLPLNEYASLIVGLGICYGGPSDSMAAVTGFDPRILNDWVYSFRYHSHSPHSSIIAFETLRSNSARAAK